MDIIVYGAIGTLIGSLLSSYIRTHLDKQKERPHKTP